MACCTSLQRIALQTNHPTPQATWNVTLSLFIPGPEPSAMAPTTHAPSPCALFITAGDVERDFWLSLELLKSPKDHVEFTLVRDWIRDALVPCAARVEVEVPKSVLKQVGVPGSVFWVPL